ncbi:site-specific integrase [Paraburkholderia rhizosphaerae]|uniref:Site-specific recombinase XerD n=1 Tax=Paraburkholderia rhizosphaerae TaxID=480658 RepID=A0A4R8LPK4_9BURK|nr:site-specific integrase [Paraburkholderia rhizosphaerae]TDY48251.1 site-specific recombinase XerD [Paraburkholderia rhizosphaerae]
MANKPQSVARTRLYTRSDFTALRAFVQRVPAATIARLYFTADEDGHEPTPGWVESYLRRMQAELVDLAIEHGSPVLADHLKQSARRHGSARLTAVSLKMVEQAAGLAVARPAPEHGVGMWFRPLVALRLKDAGLTTLGELAAFCNARGGSWWRAIRRIGPGRARRIVAWLRQHEATLGSVAADVDERPPFTASDREIVEIGGRHATLVPLERMALHAALSGADGDNRSRAFAYIHARHDLEAVRAYLYQYRDQPKTLRAYTKELERFLLWTVSVRGRALSSVLADDCEAYKDFLKAPSPAFVGPRFARSSARWRPFASAQPSADTQKYAVRALRAAFAWLVDVRYLAGNPWQAVRDPVVIERETDMDIGRALPAGLWQRARRYIDTQCAPVEAHYWRTVRTALLLSGDSGLRREELTVARREKIRPSPHGDPTMPVWELTVVGKRKKERTVPVSPAAIGALRAHWADRGLDFDTATDGPLLRPVFIPPTPLALARHGDGMDTSYVPDAINKMVRWAMKRLVAGMPDLTVAEMAQLASTSPHAFRHTFGTQAGANDVPLDVIQRIMGHASLQTTTIYVQAERERMMKESQKYFAKALNSNAAAPESPNEKEDV